MIADELEEKLQGAEDLVEHALEVSERAMLCLYRNDHVNFVRLMRESVARLGCAVVAFDAIANECERLTMS